MLQLRKNILLLALNETKKKAYLFTSFFSIFAGIFIYLTVKYSSYFLIGSIPLTIIAGFLIVFLIREISKAYNEIKKREENLPDGIYKKYFDKNKNVKEVYSIINGKKSGNYKLYSDHGQLITECNYLDGKYDGDYFEYYPTGDLKLKCHFKFGLQNGKSFLYNRNGKLMREAEFQNGNYINQAYEYYENGKTRMIVNVSNGFYSFYNTNEIKLCEITIKLHEINIEEIRNEHSVWRGWIWNKDYRVDFQPQGIWKNYRENGCVDYELDFSSKYYNSQNSDHVLKRYYDSKNNILTKNYVKITRLNIETFYKDFAVERLVDKHARYRTIHLNPGGWIYADFDINPIKELDDLLDTENSAIPPN